jgi:hypothetical protein
MSNQEHPPFGKPEGSTSLAIKIGLAVFLAILALTAIRWLYANWVMQQAVESSNQSISKIQVRSWIAASCAWLLVVKEVVSVRNLFIAPGCLNRV